VGRTAELARLVASAGRAPSVSLVCGEAGIGKSRLVEELAAVAGSDRRVLLGRCHELAEPFPLGPLIAAVAGMQRPPPAALGPPLLQPLRTLLPEWAGHLARDLGPATDARARRHGEFRALDAMLRDLGPALCILEDLQWADEATLEFLVFLRAEPPPDLGLVLTCRTAAGDPRACLPHLLSRALPSDASSIVEVTSLAPEELAALVTSVLGPDAVSSQFVRSLHAWTGGIPSAVLAVLDELRSKPATEDDLPVPPVLRERVKAALHGLGEDARLIASAAAVAGRPATEEHLAAVARLHPDAATDGLLQAIAAGVLHEQADGLYGYRQALAARAAYEAIAGPRRRRLHDRCGRELERDGRPGSRRHIAYHLKAAGAQDWPLHAELAAAEAAASGDDQLAASLLEDVLSTAELPSAARIRAALALGDAARYSVTPERAVRLLRSTLNEEPMPAGVRGELRLSLSRLLGHAGEGVAARAETRRAVGELRQRPALAVCAMINLARSAASGDGTVEDGLLWLDRAVRKAGRETDRVAQIVASSQRAAVLLRLGDPRGWAAVREIPPAGDAPEERLQLSCGQRSLAEACISVGHYRRAGAFLANAELLHDQTSADSWGRWLEATRVSLDWCLGRWEGLDGRLRLLQPQTPTAAAPAFGGEVLRSSLLLARGETVEARRLLGAMLETARHADDVWNIAAVSGRLARLQLERQDPRGALEVLADALTAVQARADWVAARAVAPEAVEALVACREHERARQLVAALARGLRGRDAPAARAALACCRGTLAEADGHSGDAARQFGRAEAVWRTVNNPYEAARARERAARCARQSDRETAEGLLRSALRTFDGLGAVADGRRVRAELKACAAWRGGRTGYGERLSPREAQVARLAGEGLTNRAIAEVLYISPRTVELHVAAALRKLGLRSRRELPSGSVTVNNT
jgi:DNA-binding CsgD family transcriptional regulator